MILDDFERSLVLGLYPADSEIIDVRPYRPGYLDYPCRVSVRRPGGKASACVLKRGARDGGIEREARLLPVLARLGLPVPEIMVGSLSPPEEIESHIYLVWSELPGEPLPWIRPTLAEAALTCRLHSRAVARLHGLTEPLLREAVSQELPRHTLIAAYEGVLVRGGAWLDVPIFAEGLHRLRPLLQVINTPLVFSNGDYNPLNYLHEGEALTGWLDFSFACFEDPYIGLAKFIVWGFDTVGWGAGVQAGLVQRHLYDRNVSRSEFAPRLILECLYRLQAETSLDGEQDATYRQAVLRVLEESLSW